MPEGPPPPTRNEPGRRFRRFGDGGAALLEQWVIAGVGNILRAQSLFWAGVHPARLAGEIDRNTFHPPWTSLYGRTAYACPACQPR